MKQIFIALAGLVFGLSMTACKKETDTSAEKLQENETQIQQYLSQNSLTAQKTTNGLYYIITQANPNALLAKEQDSLFFYYKASRLDGFAFDSIPHSGDPAILFYLSNRLQLLPGLQEGLALMREGEKATFLLPSNLAFGSLSDDKYFPPYTPMRIDAELVRIENEDKKISRYISEQGLTGIQTTTSGLRYTITQASPDSVKADTGKTASVRYSGRFLSGAQFDSNISSTDPMSVQVGAGKTVRGFDEGIAKLRKGEKAILIFPSSLGYGAAGSGFNQQTGVYAVPPYSPLVYEVEVVDVK